MEKKTQQNADEEFLINKKLYRTLLDMMNGFAYCKMIYADGQPIDFEYLIVNQAFEKLTGLQNVTGKKISELIPDIRETDQELIRTYGRVASSGIPESFETYTEFLDKWFSISVSCPEKDHFVAIFDVINQRKEAEKSLYESKADLSAILDSTDESVILISADETVMSLNSVAAAKLGGLSGDFIGKNIFDLLPPEVVAYRRSLIQQVKETFKPLAIEDQHNDLWLMNRIYPILDSSGKVSRIAIFSRDISQSKNAENVLLESESRYRSLFENSLVGILHTYPDGTVLGANPEACRLLQRTEDEICRVGRSGIVATADPHLAEALAVRSQTGQFSGVLSYLRADGTTFQAEIASNEFLDSYGQLHSNIVFRDITKRKLFEDALRENELRFRNLFERNNAIMLLIEPESGLILDANKSAADFYGYSLTELRSLKIHDINVLPCEKVKSERLNALNERRNYFIFPHRLANGEQRIVEVHSSPIDYEGNKLLFSIIHDITDRKKAEDALSKSEAKFRRLYESASLGIFQSTPDGKVISVNPAFVAMFGYDSAEDIKNSIPDISSGLFADKNRRDEILSMMEENPDLKTFENIYLRKDGNTFVGQLHISRVFDESGRLEYVEGFIEDITQRKLSEEALLNSKLQYDKLAANIPVGVYVLHSDVHGTLKLAYVSPRISELTGLSAESLIYDVSSIYKSIHPGDQAGFAELNEECLRLKRPFDWSGRTCVSGEVKWIHITSSPELLGNGDTLWHGLIVDITNEKLAEEALIEALNRLLKIASRVPGVVYQYKLRPDGTSCFPYASEGMNEIYHIRPDEVLEDASLVFANIHPDDRTGVSESIHASANELTPWKYEYRVKFGDGTVRWLLGNALPQKEDDGSVLWHGFITDITVRKKNEEELRYANWQNASIIEGTHVGTWEWNIQTGETIFSEEWAKMIGYTLDELAPVNIKTWEKFIHPDDLKKSAELLERHFAGELPYYDLECQMIHKNGQLVWIHDRGCVITRTDDGKPLMMFGTHTDITERKLAEEELRANEIKFKTLFEANTDGILIFNVGPDGPSSTITDLNENAAKMVGYTKAEMLTMLPNQLEKDYTEQKMTERGQDLLSKGMSHFETKILHKNGREIDVETKVVLVNFMNQPALMNIVRDISDRKSNEKQLEQYAMELSKQIAEKDKYFSIIAHDLRGPFGSILGLTHEMAEHLSDMTIDQLQQIATAVKKSASNLNNLISNLLDWSLMNRGLTTYNPEYIMLSGKIHESTLLSVEAAVKKEIEVDYDISEKLNVIADGNMLGCILRNLVTNAVKFTERGGNIHISASETFGNKVLISVKDTGIGMNTSKIDNLFQLVTQTNQKGTEGEPSTGLGLIICKDFVEKHGGELWVESELETGSTFYFTLPSHQEIV